MAMKVKYIFDEGVVYFYCYVDSLVSMNSMSHVGSKSSSRLAHQARNGTDLEVAHPSQHSAISSPKNSWIVRISHAIVHP